MKSSTYAEVAGQQVRTQQIVAAQFQLLRALVRAMTDVAIAIEDNRSEAPTDILIAVLAMCKPVLEDTDGNKALDVMSEVVEHLQENLTEREQDPESWIAMFEPAMKAARRLSKLTSNLRTS